MNKIKLIGLIFLLITASLQAISKDALYKKLVDAYSGISSFQASVKQDNYFAQINKTISYTGNIYSNPGRMVIRFEKPNFQRLMVSGGMVDLFDSSSKTVFRSRMQPEFGKMNPVEILQHYWKKSTVTLLGSKGNLSDVSLKPFSDPVIVTLTATINNKTGLVQSLGYTDANGNRVSYTFSGIKTNGKIPDSVWQYTYPKDVQVVQQ